MDYFLPSCKSKRRLDTMVAIVTGCNSGIGLETAKDLYKRGAKVILACQTEEYCNDAETAIKDSLDGIPRTGFLTIAELDLADQESVRSCAKKILETEKKIDILINNAGVMTSTKNKTIDGFEMNMGVNHLGHALFTLLLLPLLKRSCHARIVLVASMIHKYYPLHLDDMDFTANHEIKKAYGRSKSAVILFSKALDIKFKEQKISNISTYSVHPGYVNTSIAQDFRHRVDFRCINASFGWIFQSPKSGAQTSLYCAVDEACEGQSGLYYSKCAVSSCGTETRNPILALKLFDETLKAVGLEDPFERL